ncbi:hypothetical protein C8T65DRAFT_650433 [Cerioporus squamosus]|nr:hypothetical protein C8T65DRAFT_650433 [Cerioporus squamosus]
MPEKMVVGVTGSDFGINAAGLLASGAETGGEAEGIEGSLTGTEGNDGALAAGRGALGAWDGRLTGSGGGPLGALTGGEGLGMSAGALTGSDGEGRLEEALAAAWVTVYPTFRQGTTIKLLPEDGILTGSEPVPTGALTGSAGEGALTGGTSYAVQTGTWLSTLDAVRSEGAVIEGVSLTGTPEGAPANRTGAGALTGRLLTDGAPTGALIDGVIAGALPVTDGRLTGTLTEGACTPLTGSEGATGRFVEPGACAPAQIARATTVARVENLAEIMVDESKAMIVSVVGVCMRVQTKSMR